MVIKLGLIGYSEGNGHPFSFSSIINGFDYQCLVDSGWKIIADYLAKVDDTEIGFTDAQVTHVWTPYTEITEAISAACRVETICQSPSEMLSSVDAVIIARDDYTSHMELAAPFLQANIPVFIDKPLTLDLNELDFFRPFLESGLLMSCSGLRFARELDTIKTQIPHIGTIKAVNATVVLGWEKYGIHMLDILDSLFGEPATAIIGHNHGDVQTHTIEYPSFVANLINVGNSCKTFQVDIFAEKKNLSVKVEDNFYAFKRTMRHFIKLIKKHHQRSNAVKEVEPIIKTLIAGRLSRRIGKKLIISELETYADK